MKKYVYEYSVVKSILDKSTNYEFSNKYRELNIITNEIEITVEHKNNLYIFNIYDEDNNKIISFIKNDKTLLNKIKELNVLKNIVRISDFLQNDEFIKFNDGLDPDITLLKQHSLRNNIILIGNGHEFTNVVTLTGEKEIDLKNIFIELINHKNINEFPDLLNIKIYLNPILFTRIEQDLAKLPYVKVIEDKGFRKSKEPSL